MDKQKFQYEGMKWLMELELLNHPQAINTLKFNVLMASRSIKEVELLIYRENKTMLVLVELSWWGRTFHKETIFADVQEILNGLLPSFRFRVTDNPKIMEMAVERVKKALTGGKNESSTISNNGDSSKQPDQPVIGATVQTEALNGDSTSSPTNSEEPPKAPKVVLSEVSGDDSSKE